MKGRRLGPMSERFLNLKFLFLSPFILQLD